MNKLTQQQVFSLYLANPEQRVKPNTDLHKKTFKLLGMKDPIVFCELDNVKFNYSVSDCKLILKRISDMSYENWVELAGYVFDLKLVNETAITIRDLLMNGDGAMLSFKSIVKINEWLITHGYCIDESWITNGWVEVE